MVTITNREEVTLVVAVTGVILQAVAVWQNRKRKRRGRHRRE